jgi:hypothetical protein
MRSPFRYLIFDIILAVFQVGTAHGREEPPSCKSGSLPPDVQNSLKRDFGSWKIQEPEDLEGYTRKTWASANRPKPHRPITALTSSASA